MAAPDVPLGNELAAESVAAEGEYGDRLRNSETILRAARVSHSFGVSSPYLLSYLLISYLRYLR